MPLVIQRAVTDTSVARQMACAWVRFRAGSIATHYISFVKETRPPEFLASLARILKEPTRSPPSVAGVLYSDKRTKISAETGALGRFY